MADRSSRSLDTRASRVRFAVLLVVWATIGAASAVGVLTWGNPLPFGTVAFWRVVELRATTLVVVLVVAVCQACATVAFQTVTNNRILTPSIMGFESLYVVIQTGAVYLFGVAGVVLLQGLGQFVAQVVVMVAFALLLYGWLLTGRRGDLHVMLLVGIVIGAGLGSVSSFMQRLLAPSEFDVLSARMFGNLSNAHPEYLPVAVPLCVLAAGALVVGSRRLNVMALGRDVVNNLGLDHRRELLRVLFLVAVLMAVSTALVGRMTFLGFLAATLAYQLADSHDHRLVFPVAILVCFAVLCTAYFVMRHVFYAGGAVSVVIELIGGSVFLVHLLRKGRL